MVLSAIGDAPVLQEHSISTIRNACLMAGLEVTAGMVTRAPVSLTDCGARPGRLGSRFYGLGARVAVARSHLFTRLEGNGRLTAINTLMAALSRKLPSSLTIRRV